MESASWYCFYNAEFNANRIYEFDISLCKKRAEAKEKFLDWAEEMGIYTTFMDSELDPGWFLLELRKMCCGYWQECLVFSEENLGVKEFEKMTPEVIGAFIKQKVEENADSDVISEISLAMLRLGVALDNLYKEYWERVKPGKRTKAGKMARAMQEQPYVVLFRCAILAAMESTGFSEKKV
jgi:hypothetical protein